MHKTQVHRHRESAETRGEQWGNFETLFVALKRIRRHKAKFTAAGKWMGLFAVSQIKFMTIDDSKGEA